MARFQATPLLLAAIMSAACTTVEPAGRVATPFMADRHAKDEPCESSITWMGHCMAPRRVAEPNELRWRDPVAEYTPDVLCTGECMVPWENNTVYEEAKPLPRKKQPPPLFDWLRELFKRE